MIPLIEALHDLDMETDTSVIGNSYGDIYEKQLEMAKANPKNATAVSPNYEKYMKPLITGVIKPGRAKL